MQKESRKMLAVIFDMDGVLVDNTSYHLRAWQKFLQKHGLKFTQAEFKRKILGRTNPEILKTLFKNSLPATKLKKYADEKEGLYRKIYSPQIKPIKGLHSFLKVLKENGIKIALATAAPSENVSFVLKATHTKKYFKIVIDMSDIKKGKPNPEIFLKAAKKLKVKASSCIVIEDSLGGIKAAKRAGMKVVAITTTHPKNELRNVDYYVEDFKNLTLKKVNKIFHASL